MGAGWFRFQFQPVSDINQLCGQISTFCMKLPAKSNSARPFSDDLFRLITLFGVHVIDWQEMVAYRPGGTAMRSPHVRKLH
ncbi:MAG: hypothetical protein ACI9MJ_000547, partial [Alphaproteobacteria bacterium]